MITVPEFKKRKTEKKKLSMVTCYDASFARVLNESPIDVLLVGDSSSMVMHGHDSTIHADIEMMALHVAAVARTAKNKFIVGDMPFLSVRKGLTFAVECTEKLIRAGAHAVKIEGVQGNEVIIRHLVESGIPVMGHLGLTPQFVNVFGGMKVQAKSSEDQDLLFRDAKTFQDLGCFSLVLECIPASLGGKVSRALDIPTIGIGAGVECDGQVFVLQDLLGFNPGFKPKFLRQYMNGFEHFSAAFSKFHQDVAIGSFPNESESY